MKILIIDDNNQRVAQIVNFLAENRGILRDEISRVGCAHEALTVLADQKFDLLFLDLMIPRRLDDVPDVNSSIQLLTEINETDNLIKPRKIVGLTAYEEAANVAADVFHESTWTLLQTSEIADDWLETIGRCVDYVKLEISHVEDVQYKCDLLILTALPSELDAVHRLPWNWEPPEPADDTSFAVRGSLIVAGRTFRVVSAHADRMGMVSTAVLASKLIAIYRPKICAMPGICAGVPGRAGLGDVVFADVSWNYQSGKFVVDKQLVSGFEMEPHQIGVDPAILSRAEQLAKNSALLNGIWNAWPAGKPANPFKILRGPMASGSAVLADTAATEKIIEQNRKTRAIEMEAYGLLLAAAHASRPRPIAFIAKSVCDYADDKKSDDYQAYCCEVSAKTLQIFIESYIVDFC
ncbi:phosphorylase family protein [Xanthomonas euvesicatoria]|uniref:phosphorylase family protein n=1 Tax=Xanthomonas euvesicatoria TaxID=456327 RepID=UPI0010ACFD72|nr:response regulator [Xanthomonas euvesicatoria]